MRKAAYQMSSLFDQLGLESTDEAIAGFVKSHQLSEDLAMEDAPFWKLLHIQFFKQAREQDADWVELVDERYALLHKSSMKR
jgi:hypothetical protein